MEESYANRSDLLVVTDYRSTEQLGSIPDWRDTRLVATAQFGEHLAGGTEHRHTDCVTRPGDERRHPRGQPVFVEQTPRKPPQIRFVSVVLSPGQSVSKYLVTP